MKQIYTFLVFAIFFPLSINAVTIMNDASRIVKIYNVKSSEIVPDFEVNPGKNHEFFGVQEFFANIRNKIYRIRINAQDTIIYFREIDGEVAMVKYSELLDSVTINNIEVS